MKGFYITVAPQGYSGDARTDYICKGKNDERILQEAIERCVQENKNLFLLNGVYHIDSFADLHDGGPRTALCFPNAWREISMIGQNHEYGMQKNCRNGVVLYVSAEALSSIEEDTDVIRSPWTQKGMQNGSSLRIENIAVVLANNQHPIRCIDLRRVDRIEVKNVSLISYGDLIGEDSLVGLNELPPVPAHGCIGLTMTDGSNYDYSNYTNVQAWGFDEGIQVGGEHVVCINCGATIGRYGFTFGNYPCQAGRNHPITLINCLDERNINLPLFNECGDDDGHGGHLRGEQEVTLISFNIERLADKTPGGVLGDLMRETYPGAWKGSIDFTVQPAWWHCNALDCQLWENDGSGIGIRTRNNCHKTVCSTAERLSYYPTYGQQIFDTDLNKMVICLCPETKKWVDFNGVEV